MATEKAHDHRFNPFQTKGAKDREKIKNEPAAEAVQKRQDKDAE